MEVAVHATLFLVLVMLSGTASLGAAGLLRRSASGFKKARAFSDVFLAHAALMGFMLVESTQESISARIFWDSAQLAVDAILGALYVRLAYAHIGRASKRVQWVINALAVCASVGAIFLMLSPWHGLARTEAAMVNGHLLYPFELLDALIIVPLFLSSFVSIGILAQSPQLAFREYRMELIGVALVVSYPLIAVGFLFGEVYFFGTRDPSPLILLLLSPLAVLFAIRSRTLTLVPVARSIVIESLREAVVIVDLHETVVDLNAKACSLLPDVQIGSSIRSWPVWSTLAMNESEAVQDVIDDRTWSFQRTAAGEGGALVTGRDVTDQVAATSELEQRVAERTEQLLETNAALRKEATERAAAQEKLRILFDNAYQWIGMLDAKGHILSANRALLETIDARLETLVGLHFCETSWWDGDPEQLERVKAAVVAATEGRSSRFEITRTIGDHEAVVDLSLTPVIEDGRVSFIIPEGRDITSIRRAENERAMLQQQREHGERLELLGQLSGAVAHDLNNLLGVVLASLDAIEISGDLSEESREWLSYIDQASQSAAGVTAQLLAFSRMNRASTARRVEANTLVQECTNLLSRLVGPRCEIELDLTDSPTPIQIEEARLEQCLMNLVLNARDSFDGEGVIRISSRCSDKDALELTVSDNGPGMDAATLAKIFEPFFTTKRLGAGTGLGLVTVKNIVTQAGGELHVKSAPGEGTTFVIRLPLCGEASGEIGTTDVDLTGKERIMVVEDLARLRDLVCRELRRFGYDVYGFASAEEAQASAITPDVLVTDVLLPGKNGLALAHAIRKRVPGVDVVFVTGYGGEIESRLGDFARSTVLYKPFPVASLARTIRQLLSTPVATERQ